MPTHGKIAFIDTEVDLHSKKAVDFGAVSSDGNTIHTHKQQEFAAFAAQADAICGHNIVHHDLRYTPLSQPATVIDTLYLSPLLFPLKPYHRLVKDDKLQVDELNNPVNDALKARDLFYDEVEAWNALPDTRKQILYHLLHREPEFGGFFRYLKYTPPTGSLISRLLSSPPNITQQIRQEYGNHVCHNADIAAIARQYPVELAYALAIIGADDLMSITPAWVQRNYPHLSNVMAMLRNTPCGGCPYCDRRLDAHQGLRDFFGYSEFRTFTPQTAGAKPSHMQQEAVESALRGESLLTIFPTGGGKSLTFQLPALMAGRNMHGLTVVLSPLQSLMKDQVDNLAQRGISDAVTINGLLDPIERSLAIQQVADGSANLLYIAPEMLRNNTIERLLLGRNVVRIVIDEAHCFSAWGQDFRVDYLYIGDFIRQLQEKKQNTTPIAVSCFTATAKQKVITDICDYFAEKLNIKLRVFAAASERVNLRYSVIHTDTDEEKYSQLRSLILAHKCPSIIYVSRTRRSVEIARHLHADGIRALPFNGKMEVAEKVANQDSFMHGDTQVIVATSAFGMGVDKKDVGLVVHYDISDSLESYLQEAGRAGRDPNTEADCYVLYTDNDLDKHFILLNQTKLSISEIQQIWQVIKDLTAQQTTVSCSPLELARKAGWSDETYDIETRVKAAISALENAGFVKRGNNTPHIFATGITVASMIEARQKLAQSRLFDDHSREEAARILSSLISRRATTINSDEAESRIDYLADLLCMSKETVIRNVSLMRQEGILADSKDMQALAPKSTLRHELTNTLRLEKFILDRLTTETQELSYKKLNEEAQSAGLTHCTVRRIKLLLHFLSIKSYIRKEEHKASESVRLHLQVDADATAQRFDHRAELCHLVAEKLLAERHKGTSLITFSIVEMLSQCTASLITFAEPPTIADMEEALLYMSKTELIKLEGGFMVVYNPMQISRKVERRTRYSKDNYRLLDDFYRQRIQQIHIVGEYANLMVRDYDAALRYVSDYFLLDHREFIARYFKGERRTQITHNITPNRYKQIFGQLSARQKTIIDDNKSRHIVVAAGPGSGKTRVLVHKLASLLLLEDVKHEQLLMLTFSRAAATEFKKRLMELVGNAAHFVEIKTFHSYSFDLIGRQGTLEESSDVVQRAAEMIEKGEVEASRIAKSVLVVDEAQDMSNDDFRLVRALMNHNEEMRVIAVGDDDQNIYTFRGSNSRHLQSLISQYGATLYEMTDNYRSAKAIVDHSNRFVQQIPNRMKHTPIKAVTSEPGTVEVDKVFTESLTPHISGSTAILTRTNEQALQIAYLLEQKGIHAQLLQSGSEFRFINLAEVRYFTKHLAGSGTVISNDAWQAAKERTLNTYSTSKLLPAMHQFWDDFETTNRTIYRSDLRQFLLESDVDDFIAADSQRVFVSTIHKAKGREFDTVHLLACNADGSPDDLRTLYVGLTRAKRHLYIYNTVALNRSAICINLTLRDVWLDYFRKHKTEVLKLRSGDILNYSNGYLVSRQGSYIGALSKSRLQQINELQQKGYYVTRAEVSYVLAWRPRDEQQEVAVSLANLYLKK
ncbi:MAG: RecQ family ATP-dependent DNA helicase [Bacteroidales bacterium]|nr:RecQ family ATP-dependent DNA helicase [Bacteroidales bacterium]